MSTDKPKFTPGPWEVSARNPYSVCKGRYQGIAWSTDKSAAHDEKAANMRLIAASPDMFELLDLLAECSRKPTDDYEFAYDAENVAQKWIALRARINGGAS